MRPFEKNAMRAVRRIMLDDYLDGGPIHVRLAELYGQEKLKEFVSIIEYLSQE